MERVRLIHWNTEEAKEKAGRFQSFGYDVDYAMPDVPNFLRELGKNPPAVVVIDLSRLPSQGRDLALLIRKRKSTRTIPLVFIGGPSEKAARIKQLVPDAVFTSWEEAGNSLKAAIDNPPMDPAVPVSQFAAYAGKPLTEKLGIKANSIVGLMDAPDDFMRTLGHLPEGARVQGRADSGCDLFIWFVRSREQLEKGILEKSEFAARGSLWIAWPKRSSRFGTDISQQMVREVGLAAGLVDYKVCSIDEIWSGLLFTWKNPGISGRK